MCKELWCEMFDEFVFENEREPSDQEMQDIWSSSWLDRYDRIRDELRNQGIFINHKR